MRTGEKYFCNLKNIFVSVGIFQPDGEVSRVSQPRPAALLGTLQPHLRPPQSVLIPVCRLQGET